jgi:2-iminobutanoate/2-iminopropanoate deaminase
MKKTIITTAGAPKAIGPYSQAVRVGDFLFLSGQISINPETGELVIESFEAQVRQIFKNIEAVLKAAGADFTTVVKSTVFLKDIRNFVEMNKIYTGFFPNDPPARSAVQVAKLPKDVDIEIEMIAYLG